MRAVLLGLLLVLVVGCTASPSPPDEPLVTCIGYGPEGCDDVWREYLAAHGESAVDDQGNNRVAEVRVEKATCDAAIDIRFVDGMGLATAGGLC